MNGALRSMWEGNKASKAEVSLWEKPEQSSRDGRRRGGERNSTIMAEVFPSRVVLAHAR